MEPPAAYATALVARARRGDRGAFATLIEGRWTPLVGLARSVVGDAEAEDAVQEGLIRAWQKLSSLRDETLFTSWLTRIVLRFCLSRARRRRLAPVALEEVPEPCASEDPTADIDLGRALAALAPRQRAVMHLTVVEGMSDREIGALMKITAAAVRSHRRRARQRLSHLLNGASSP